MRAKTNAGRSAEVRRPFRKAILAAVPAALISVIGTPTPAEADGAVFEDTARVLEVQVPVNVVARDGEPVRGLTAGDFEIRDGGKRREISRMEVIDLEVLEPGATRTEIEHAVPAAGRRHFLVLFDLSFS